MRVAILVFCAGLSACAQSDKPQVVRQQTVTTTASSTPAADYQPAPVKAWAPTVDPGDTTPQGWPTERSLLRWVYHLPADSFPELPKPVVTTLDNRGCAIPLPGPRRENVITGAFTAKGTAEWAVLCSVHDTSRILILSAANGTVLDSLNKSEDSRWMQGNGGHTWLFSRAIAVVSVSDLNVVPADTIGVGEEVGEVYYGRFLPKPIDHDAIDEAFVDKASTTFYFAQGRWFSVGSSD